MKELQRTSRRQYQQQVRTKAIAVSNTGEDRISILEGLSKFAGAASEESQRQMRAEIETKKALGASRAAQDLLVSSQHRQGITEDDVLATKLAYNAVVGQHDTIEAGNQFVEWYQANPDADDKAIEAKKQELYQPLFERYSGDPDSVKQVSLQVQESQFNLMPVQEKIKQNYNHQKKSEALTMNIGDLLADPNADTGAIVNTEVPTVAKSLGLSEFEYKEALMKEMVNRADNGDARLLNTLESTNWAKDSVLISKAKASYESFVAKENASIIGDTMGDIELENTSLTVPWSTTLKKIERLNDRFPNTYSAARISQLKQARARAVKAQTDNSEMNKLSFANLNDETGLPLKMDGRWDEPTKKKYLKELEAGFSQKTQELIDADVDPVKANAIMMKQRLDWSRVNRYPLPSLQNNLEALIGLNPEDYPNSNDLPEFATSGLSILQTMDDATVDIYFTNDKDKAMAINIRSGMTTRDPYSAYKRAYNVRQNPYKVSGETRQELADEIASEVDSKFEHGFISELFGNKNVPEWQRSQIASRVTEIANINMYNGADLDANVKQSIAEVTKDYSQTFNGTMINKPIAVIADKLGLTNTPLKANDYLEAYILSNQESITKDWGSEVEPADITFDVAENGQTFILRYKGGEQIGGRNIWDDVKKIGRKANLKHLRDLQTSTEAEIKAKREADEAAAEEAAHMVLFYQQWADGEFK